MSSAPNPSEARRVERIAVVFVHGQGQQTPMTDVLDLAQSVWRIDPNVSGGGAPAPVYSVPVYDGNDSDQRRIITEETPIKGTSDLVKVDFYQFYWADLMQGNRFTELWAWFAGLMKRNPKTQAIPKPIQPLRNLTMGIALAVAGWAVLLGASTASVFATVDFMTGLKTAGLWLMPQIAIGAAVVLIAAVWAGGRWASTREHHRTGAPLWASVLQTLGLGYNWLPVLLFLVVAADGVVSIQFNRTIVASDALSIVLSLASFVTFVALLVRRWRIWAFMFGLILIALSCVLAEVIARPPAPWLAGMGTVEDYLLGATLIPAVALGLVFWQLKRDFLVPVMTESARLFSPSPSNIPNQDRIRKRGVQLLDALHAPGADYDRIVFLAHSLGTAVTYNLLTYYWGKVYNHLDHRGSAGERNAAQAAAAAVAEAGEARDDARKAGETGSGAAEDYNLKFRRWRAATRRYGAALRRPVAHGERTRLSPWRVSDFITIGSPLTYASLLLETLDETFLDQVRVYRRYATCPPQSLETADGSYSFTLPDGRPHHAALYAATCWTNLYFPNKGIVWGDIIGGEIAGSLEPNPAKGKPSRLGYGVLDVALPHDPRLGSFTHNAYWPWPTWADPDLPPAHIEALRSAFHFFADPAKADSYLMARFGA